MKILKILLCGMWVYLALPDRDSPGAIIHGHFLPTTTSSMRPGCGWVRRGDRATTLKRETATTIPPPPPTLCSLAVTGCGVAIGHDSRKTRGNQSVVQSLSTRLGILILLAFLNDSLDLVLDQSLLCHFLQLHKNILNVSNFVGNSKVVILYQKTVVHPFRK